ncbi:MAG: DNA cytosine methyltransferase [Deltaproteobacteria bacterium]|jgi:DNA (cytosine-5)-methyltransferase 1|nr:DNA cytosine methyltransferase [Deltaproteobacteria bacterium]
MSNLKALSLFSGAGGMDIGLKKSGFNILADIEIDKFCCETLRAAVEREQTDTEVFETDIRQVNLPDLSKKLNIGKNNLDLLFGGPPCQPFSLAGKQAGLNDLRGPLLFEIIRFAEYLRPKVILIEQVKGLLSAKNSNGDRGGVFNLFISELERIGFVPKWKVCCAADYGVPQLRERLFFVATYAQNNFNFPESTHSPTSNLFGSLPYLTVGEVISDLDAPSRKIPGTNLFDRNDSHIDVTPARDRERISYVPEGSYLAAQTGVSSDIRCNLSSKDTTKYLRLNRNKPSNTLRCGEIFYHPTENRYLTPREYMRLHGYDDNYLLRGPIRARTGTVNNLDQHRQVANSVPPPLAEAIGKQIKIYLNE